ncbi:MAG: aminotransferase class V-fold PLP-dependent enzyme [Acidobacteriota bacterium]
MNPLAARYSRFRVAERLLLTGHSHQAWPDVAFEGQQQAWLDAAELVDRKWARAAEVADTVRRHWARLLGDPDGAIALGANTHELVVRLLSALLEPRGTVRARLVTSTGEFHTIRRQFDRLAEAGVEVVKVDARPVETLAARLAAAVDDRTAAVFVSSVLFETSEIVPGLAELAARVRKHGAALVVDAYHHVNVVPFDIDALGLGDQFVVGGGYKYCQLGEGNCFLRLPPGCALRPVITGWFAEFATLKAAPRPGVVAYGEGADRFAGATYDPTAHYRARSVFTFFEDEALTPVRLRAISERQVALLEQAFTALDLDPARVALPGIPAAGRAGFLALRAPEAAALADALRARGVNTDARGEWLRFGPAPYLSDTQLEDAMAALGEVVGR